MIAIIAQVAVQFNMVLLMTATPLAIDVLIPGVNPFISQAVIVCHILGMFLPGLWLGGFIRTRGPYLVTYLGLVLQLVCQILLFVCQGDVLDSHLSTSAVNSIQLTAFFLALTLLGVGWNFSYIAGTELLKHHNDPRDANFVQTVNEFARFIATAVASFLSVLAQDAGGWNILLGAGVGTVVIIVILLIVLQFVEKQQGGKKEEAGKEEEQQQDD